MKIRKVDPRQLDAHIWFDYVVKKAGYGPVEFVVRCSKKHHMSTGRSWGWRAVVTAGTDPMSMKHAIIHEVAHSSPEGWQHGEGFYKALFALAKKCDFDMDYLVKREAAYKPRGSGRVAKRYGYKPKW